MALAAACELIWIAVAQKGRITNKANRTPQKNLMRAEGQAVAVEMQGREEAKKQFRKQVRGGLVIIQIQGIRKEKFRMLQLYPTG